MFNRSESKGLPAEAEARSELEDSTRVAFPMLNQELLRCYNLATSATMALWDAYRQLHHTR